MSMNSVPHEAPPPYEESVPQAPPGPPPQHPHSDHLQVPHEEQHGVSASARRSMEDEARELPPHWVRQYDGVEQHQFFVDTSSNPPRSIWQHPYDDDVYLASVSPAERERINGLLPASSRTDPESEHSSGEERYDSRQGQQQDELKGVHKLGRKMKDKITGTSHAEREASRRAKEEEMRKIYEQHQRFRLAMSKAAQTGEPQLVGKDRQGRDVYVEPPSSMGFGGLGGQGLGGRGLGGQVLRGQGGFGGGRQYPGNGYGYNPYGSLYANPNARFSRPQGPYQRPMRRGQRGGLGMGIGAPLLGGLLLGEMLF
jgi:hypothetical protein